MSKPKLIVPDKKLVSRRSALKLGGAGAAAALMGPGFVRYAQAQSSEPIRIGFQVHRTGIGAAYGKWYEQTTNAAVKLINEAGGISGRPIEIVPEDDATDPGRGAEVVERRAQLVLALHDGAAEAAARELEGGRHARGRLPDRHVAALWRRSTDRVAGGHRHLGPRAADDPGLDPVGNEIRWALSGV